MYRKKTAAVVCIVLFMACGVWAKKTVGGIGIQNGSNTGSWIGLSYTKEGVTLFSKPVVFNFGYGWESGITFSVEQWLIDNTILSFGPDNMIDWRWHCGYGTYAGFLGQAQFLLGPWEDAFFRVGMYGNIGMSLWFYFSQKFQLELYASYAPSLGFATSKNSFDTRILGYTGGLRFYF